MCFSVLGWISSADFTMFKFVGYYLFQQQTGRHKNSVSILSQLSWTWSPVESWTYPSTLRIAAYG